MKHLKTYENKYGITFKEWIKNRNIGTVIIDCSNQNLIDLYGIEEFERLFYLDCSQNRLTELPNLSNLENLVYIRCSENNLSKLPDLSNLDYLTSLYCHNNNLTQLPDLSNLTNLKILYCYGNDLPFKCSRRTNNLEGYLNWHKKEYPWVWDAKKYNL